MNKIKVLYCIDVFYKLGGAEKNLLEVVSEIDKNRFEPIVACLKSGEAIKMLHAKGIRAFDLDISKIYSFSALCKGYRLAKMMRRESIDVVVTYHEGSDYFAGMIAYLAGVPVIMSSRRDMGYRLEKRHIHIYRFMNRIFSCILTVSDAVKSIIADREHAPLHVLTTVYNGVHADTYAAVHDTVQVRGKYNIPSDAVVIGIVAALREIKGHRYFLEAAAIVAHEFPQARFLIVGSPEDDEYLRSLQGTVQVLGIGEVVIFTGECKNIPEILSIIDISVISSINEGFSNTVIESMAAGKPVVATNTGGTPEAVVDGETGILVPARDACALAAGFIRLLRDPALRRAMGHAGRQKALAEFTLPGMITKIENLYVSLLRAATGESNYTAKKDLFYWRVVTMQCIKTLIGAGLRRSGITHYVRSRGRCLTILAYHRVSADGFDPLGMNISPALFESHLRYLKKKYDIISFDTAVAHVTHDTPIPPRAIVVTFDDGYRNNYTAAFPILKQLGIPATMFISAGAIDANVTLWYDTIVNAICATDLKVLDLTSFGYRIYDLSDIHKKNDAAKYIVDNLKYLDRPAREAIVRHIVQVLHGDQHWDSSSTAMLSWDEVVTMHAQGVAIGSHGLSHSILTALQPAVCEQEIRESKQLIHQRTGIPIQYFTYPNGGARDYNESVIAMLSRHGYTAACTLIPGSNITSSPYTFHRHCVTYGMLTSATGHFSGSKFEFEIMRNCLLRRSR